MRMPFGKHRETEIEDLPTDYLVYVYNNIRLRAKLKDEVYREYHNRREAGDING